MCFNLFEAYYQPANSLTVISNMRAENNINTPFPFKVLSKINMINVVTCEKNILFIRGKMLHQSDTSEESSLIYFKSVKVLNILDKAYDCIIRSVLFLMNLLCTK